jgi:tetratricopeptide (TPR) repeat protein
MVSCEREIYKKGMPQMRAAYRCVCIGKWDDAFAIWQQCANTGGRRAVWHSYFNMAVFYEKIGNYDKAIESAEKAYQLYGKRAALEYVNILKHMKYQEERVVNQLDGPK